MSRLAQKVAAFDQEQAAKTKPATQQTAQILNFSPAWAGVKSNLPTWGHDTPAGNSDNSTETPAAVPVLADAIRFAFSEPLVRIYDRKTDNLLTVAEFKALTGNFPRVEVGDGTKAWADAWLADPKRPQFMKLVFDPGYTGTEHLNRWKGWPYKPIAGNVEPFLALLRHVVGAERMPRVLQWFAYPIKNPGKRSLFALVLISNAHGLGKGLLVKTVAKLHGDGFKSPSVRSVVGEFNGWLAACTFAVCEEFSIDGNRGLMARLKELVTEPQVMLNEKNQPAYMADNLASFAFLTNDHAALHIEPNDRRFDVIDCTSAPAPASVYDDFVRWRDAGGLNALMHYLQHVDMTGFNPNGHAPMSDDKAAMADLTATDLERWLRDFSETAPKAVYTRLELKQAFEAYSGTRSTESAVGRALKRLGLGAECRIQLSKDRPRVVAIRNPDEWRALGAAAWADEYAGKNINRKAA